MDRDKRERVAWLIVGPLLAAALGVATHWVVFEYDVFWLARAGQEILSQHRVQTVDGWSHSVPGQPWINFQWLSCVVLYLASRLRPDYGALGALRSLLVALWVLLALSTVRRAVPRSGFRWLLVLTLVPWIYLVVSFRFQIRPDLFAACLFAGLLVVWMSALDATRKRAIGLVLLVAWSNLHAGTVAIGIVFYILAVLTSRQPGLGRRLVWSLAGVATLFATPQGTRILRVLRDVALRYDYTLTHNPDLQPFAWHLLRFSEGGWHLALWILFLVPCGGGLLVAWRRPEALPEPYRQRGLVMGFGLLVTLLTFQRIRAVHYQVLFFLPLVAAALSELTRWRPATRWMATGGLVLMALFLWGRALPDHVRFVGRPIGVGLSELDLPVRSTDFLRRVRPRPNLYNAYQFGGYVIGHLPELPVMIDGRDIPFDAVKREGQAAMADPEAFEGFLRQHDVNVALEVLPSTMVAANGTVVDSAERLFPRTRWALVFFDNVSVVLLRRTPEHARIIAEHEYHRLRPGIPAELIVGQATSPEAQGEVSHELERCLDDMPTSLYCLFGRAELLRRRYGDPSSATALLEKAARVNPRNPEALFRLMEAYRGDGRQRDAEEIELRFERVAVRRAVPVPAPTSGL